MKVQKSNLTKLCSFYVSDWHLVTMLLPYINRKINEQAKIATILEKDIQENIKVLLEKLNLKNKEKIEQINWTNEQRKNIFSNIENSKEIIIIVNGEKDFIKNKNEKIEKYLETHEINKKVKIINCFEVIEYNGSISDVLEEHDMVLNTYGEREISELFGNYENKKVLKAI